MRTIGASNYIAERLAEALKVSDDHGFARFTVLQPLYNLLDRDEFEGPLQELCIAEDIGVVPYFALAAGFVTGKYRTAADLAGKPRAYRVKTYLNERGDAVLAALDAVAAETGARDRLEQ